jgi:hypothetical protein
MADFFFQSDDEQDYHVFWKPWFFSYMIGHNAASNTGQNDDLHIN